MAVDGYDSDGDGLRNGEAPIGHAATSLGLRLLFAGLLSAAIVVMAQAALESLSGLYPKKTMAWLRPREGLLCTCTSELPRPAGAPGSDPRSSHRGQGRGHQVAPHDALKLERLADRARADACLGGQ